MSTTTKQEEKHQEDHHDQPNEEEPTDGIKAFLFKWIFPIYRHELLKIIPLILMMLAALFVYTVYRDIKDAMIFGEERQTMMTVQWCKVLVFILSIPVATLFMKLANVVSKDFIFYQVTLHTVLFFCAYFMINAFLIYPGRAVLHSKSTLVIRSIDESLEDWAPRLIPMAGLVLYPFNTFHYVVSELWGTISVSFLLWGYVNQITPKEAAKRYYGVLGLGAQLGPISAGEVVHGITDYYGKGAVNFLRSLKALNFCSMAAMLVFVTGYVFMQQYVMKLPRFVPKADAGGKKKSKPKMSIGDSIKYCAKNPYVLALGGLVFAYGWCMVVGELSYKDVMKLHTLGDQGAYSKWKGIESKASAYVAMFLMAFVSHNIIRVCGWKITALLAPLICSVTALTFYGFMLVKNLFIADDEDPTNFKFYSPDENNAFWASFLGIVFCIGTKAVKYASFDPAKELAYLPLTSEEKYKAKAAVDIVGARGGKGGAALFNIFVLNWIMGKEITYETVTQWVSFSAVVVMIGIWITSTLYLGNAMKKKEAEKKMKEQMENQVVDVKVDDGDAKSTRQSTVELAEKDGEETQQ